MLFYPHLATGKVIEDRIDLGWKWPGWKRETRTVSETGCHVCGVPALCTKSGRGPIQPSYCVRERRRKRAARASTLIGSCTACRHFPFPWSWLRACSRGRAGGRFVGCSASRRGDLRLKIILFPLAVPCMFLEAVHSQPLDSFLFSPWKQVVLHIYKLTNFFASGSPFFSPSNNFLSIVTKISNKLSILS